MISNAISFNDVHTYKDLNLILTSLYIAPAFPKTIFLDIPGSDGSLDLTEALGGVKYNDRECKFVFTAHPDDDFEKKKTEISNLLSGEFCKIVLDAEKEYYYEGRCEVNDFVTNGRLRQIVVTGKLKPYKMKETVTQIAFSLTATKQTITLPNSRKTVIPTISCTQDGNIITVGSASYVLRKGTYEVDEVILYEGENIFIVEGNGTMTFIYREGVL